jgi:hypothetical protein
LGFGFFVVSYGAEPILNPQCFIVQRFLQLQVFVLIKIAKTIVSAMPNSKITTPLGTVGLPTSSKLKVFAVYFLENLGKFLLEFAF